MEKVKCSLSNVYCGQHVLRECIQLAWSLFCLRFCLELRMILNGCVWLKVNVYMTFLNLFIPIYGVVFGINQVYKVIFMWFDTGARRHNCICLFATSDSEQRSTEASKYFLLWCIRCQWKNFQMANTRLKTW